LGVAQDAIESKQYDAKRLDFAVGEFKGFVIVPTENASDGSKPWVWYAPTFIGKLPDDSHTWMARQLLDAGFAIAGVDVGESYGSPAGTKTYSNFYTYVTTKYGLDAKPCLLAQSRGGLMLLNWAVENPQRVQCIAGIYAVCNLESYPGLDKCCAAYGMDAATLKQELGSHNPIDRVKSLADAKVPQLYIHGDSDKVVPVEANSGELVRRCQSHGGPASLILVPGKGHEVCTEFFQSQKIVDFLLSKGGPSMSD
jgi:dipeptidyl aminopeptidase/acylaminoacyl peptidase